jgi:ubiquinone/menaquinone biosynthesis C-methylase UbiE
VVPAAGGCSEFARHEINALVCDSFDVAAVVAAVASVVEDRGRRHRLRRGAVATALEWSAARGALDQLEFFRRRIGEARGGHASRAARPAVVLDPVSEEAARAAAETLFTARGEADATTHAAQIMDVEACFGRFLYLSANAPLGALRSGARILVTGFAIGSEMIAARRLGFAAVHGVEVERELVAICQERLRRLADMHPLHYDGDRLPYGDESFAVVASGHVIEHTVDPALHLAECMRVLQPGGLLSLEFPTRFHHTELHSGLPSLEWLPRRLRSRALSALGSRLAPLPAGVKRRWRDLLASGLQQISLGSVRAGLRRAGCDWRLVHSTRAAPGIVRCIVERRS